MKGFTRILLASQIACVTLTQVTIAFQKLEFCRSSLNPWHNGIALKLATSLVFSCKEEFLTLNVRAIAVLKIGIFREESFAMWLHRLAPEGAKAFQDELVACMRKFGNGWFALYPVYTRVYNVDWNEVMDLVNACAAPHFPRDVRYLMKTMEYWKDLLSG